MRQTVFKAVVWKATNVFVILRSQDGFESGCPERNSETITS